MNEVRCLQRGYCGGVDFGFSETVLQKKSPAKRGFPLKCLYLGWGINSNTH